MPYHYHLYARLTHRYNTAWAGEDDWVPLTPAKVTGATLTRQDDYGDSTERRELSFTPGAWACVQRLHRRHADEGVSLVRWLAAQITENFARNCRCEHDCCGCTQCGASAQYLGQRRFSLELRYYRNL